MNTQTLQGCEMTRHRINLWYKQSNFLQNSDAEKAVEFIRVKTMNFVECFDKVTAARRLACLVSKNIGFF